jgi:hypothetical protein
MYKENSTKFLFSPSRLAFGKPAQRIEKSVTDLTGTFLFIVKSFQYEQTKDRHRRSVTGCHV